MPREILHSSALLLFAGAGLAQAREFCFGVNNEQYRCEMGYCCGETECCTYYYELWWFWLVWTLILLMSCCCAFRHRRVKQRLQQQQRQREISLLAYQGASAGIRTPPTSMGFWTDCKLPDYEEVIAHPPTPPPPYTETHAPTDPGAPSEVQSEPAEEDLDSGGRRRRVTGDSGIEVCVCVSVCPLHEEDHECGGAECCPETQSSV